ncbi:MAG: malonyl-ACP O-methyltransferase BioC [Calditerrivibrio sp.]|nr:malonyl-ACP O-methyltransferase BioC [Calditerrivibrio sp.]MCA1932055.1 malonyl-ACP O-methyltransferase BioC [Calditerrivibrio sp.]
MYSKDRFLKIANFYNENAHIQRRMAVNIVNALKKNNFISYDKILEIGCGTGLLTDIIHREIHYNELHLNDINNFLKIAIPHKFILGDIEQIDLTDRYDLIVSNAVFQWIDNFEKLIGKLHSSLVDGGTLAFTTFGPLNLIEIRDITKIGLKYYSYDYYKRILSNKFKIVFSDEKVYNIGFPSPLTILKHIKYTGVNRVKKVHWNKKNMNEFCEAYEKFKNHMGYVLTYNPFYFILSKK